MACGQEVETVMPNENYDNIMNADDATETAFTDIPFFPAASVLSRSPARQAWFVVLVLIGLVGAGTLIAYLSHRSNEVDPNAPRVVLDVNGMHCPLQCGLRVLWALETLPFVLPGSVTANPKTGIVTFAATSGEAVNEKQIRRAIERAGFRVQSIQMPTTSAY